MMKELLLAFCLLLMIPAWFYGCLKLGGQKGSILFALFLPTFLAILFALIRVGDAIQEGRSQGDLPGTADGEAHQADKANRGA